MEITLEKIELVKDRTGVTYKEAKDALEKTEGNVVEAIILIEDNVDEQSQAKKFGAKSEALIDKMKEIVKRGNVARIVVKRGDDTLLNMPLNAGVLGAVVAPWGVVIGVLAAFSFKCTIEFVKDDGEVISLTEKAGQYYEEVVSRGSDVFEDFKTKAPDLYEAVKEKSEDAMNIAKDVASNVKSTADEAAEDMSARVEELRSKADEALKRAQEKAEEAAEAAEEPCDDICEKAEDAAEAVCEKAEEACEAAEEAAADVAEEVKDAVEE